MNSMTTFNVVGTPNDENPARTLVPLRPVKTPAELEMAKLLLPIDASYVNANPPDAMNGTTLVMVVGTPDDENPTTALDESVKVEPTPNALVITNAFAVPVNPVIGSVAKAAEAYHETFADPSVVKMYPLTDPNPAETKLVTTAGIEVTSVYVNV